VCDLLNGHLSSITVIAVLIVPCSVTGPQLRMLVGMQTNASGAKPETLLLSKKQATKETSVLECQGFV
jgi:hypothetical protein